MLEFHKGEVIDHEILAMFKSRAVYDDDLPTELKSLVGEPINDPWSADAGITTKALAIAETGSILISTSPQNTRLTSLAPPVHIALVDPSKSVASLDQGLAQLDQRTSVLITGPSRTADVEGVIVMGVHGPKRLIVVPWPRKIPA